MSPALNMLVFSGYAWDLALDETAKLGIRYIEPVYISKYDPGLTEDYFTEGHARELSETISRAGLRVRSMASHMDMGLTGSVAVFRRRMEFARWLGAAIIITNSSHKENRNQFLRNMDVLSGFAGELALTIALENPGDGSGYIVSDAKEGADLLKKTGWQNIKLNYDFSNHYTLTKGTAAGDPGISEALPCLAHLHLKNIKPDGTGLQISSLGKGILDYKQIFDKYPALLNLPASIELPIRFGYNETFDFVACGGTRPGLEEICQMLRDSIMFLNDTFT